VGLAEMQQEKNYIGVDLKGNRIWVGAKKALNTGLNNVAFLRTQIDRIVEYFAPGEVEEIWLTFPDPQLRFSRAKKRLTHPKFLRFYQKIMKPGGIIHLKTDSPVLYNFTLQVIRLYELELLADLDDVYAQPELNPVLQIKTHYEGFDIAESNRVHYLQFRLPTESLPDKDLELKELIRETESDRGN